MPVPYLRLGSSWYPEHWDLAAQTADLTLMREIGFNVVRVGDFAWSRFETTPDAFDTAWMADAMDRAHAQGIGVILCTPTASAPPWMFDLYPDVGFVTPEGYRHGPGGRQAADYCHLGFRERCRLIVDRMARDLGKHPALLGWQIDNELRGHQKLSLSAAALSGWHRWLEQRYGRIHHLNQVWGTHVWSQHYNRFDQIPGPHPLPNYAHNFPLLTEYRRYMNDSALDYLRLQVHAIRPHSSAPITHNSEDSLDEWDLTRDLDFAGFDCYTGRRHPAGITWHTDGLRHLKQGKRFWFMETDSEGKFDDGLPFAPGWTGNVAMLAYASGGEGLMYWPWRGNRSGSETIDHAALLHPCGKPTLALANARRVGALRTQLDATLQRFRPAPAEVAFIRAERNGHWMYIDRIAGLEANFDFRGRLQSHYRELTTLGVWRDVLYDQAPIDGYRLVVSPYLPYISSDFLARMRKHLDAGGVWIVGPYSGYLTEHNTMPTTGLLGELEEMLGIETAQLFSIHHLPVDLVGIGASEALMHALSFVPGPDDEVLGTYGGERLGGQAWGLRRRIGKGRVYVLGSEIRDAARQALYRQILSREGIACQPMPDRVVCIPQIADDGATAWALVNGSRTPQVVTLPKAGVDVLSGQTHHGSITIAGNANAFVIFD